MVKYVLDYNSEGLLIRHCLLEGKEMKMSWEKFLAVALALAILPLTLGGAIPMPSGTTTQAEYISEASGEALGLLSDSDDPVAPGVTEEPEALDPLEGDAKDLAPLGTTDDLVPLGDLVPTSWTDVQSLVTAAQNGDVLKLGGLSTPLANQTITIPAGLTLTIDGGGTNFTNYVAFICA
ncbi:MAG: hypothetical protein LBP91_05155, partial [Coriobacteriales bacterium]|nr:hypothetical protein [Coriobacteriales bacterium]